MDSSPILDATDSELQGRIAYEVHVKKPVKEDYTANREEVIPTGRKVGTVLRAAPGGYCFVKIEKWLTETENFGMGVWRQMAKGVRNVGEPVFMSVAGDDGIETMRGQVRTFD